MNEQVDNTGLLFQFAGELEALKEQLKYKQKQLEEVLMSLGVGTYHKCPITGLVYKVVVPTGKYVEFSRIGYVRTAAYGEVKGSLSKKEAEEHGFVVGK
jgi:hypothetical protein